MFLNTSVRADFFPPRLVATRKLQCVAIFCAPSDQRDRLIRDPVLFETTSKSIAIQILTMSNCPGECWKWFTSEEICRRDWENIQTLFSYERATQALHLLDIPDVPLFFRQMIEGTGYVGPRHDCLNILALMSRFRAHPSPKTLILNASPKKWYFKPNAAGNESVDRILANITTPRNPQERRPLCTSDTRLEQSRVGLLNSSQPVIPDLTNAVHQSLSVRTSEDLRAIAEESGDDSDNSEEVEADPAEQTIVAISSGGFAGGWPARKRIRMDSSKNDLGAGLLPIGEYKQAYAKDLYNKNLDKLQLLRINHVREVSTKKFKDKDGPFQTILVRVIFEEKDPIEYTYHWFHLWNCSNGEEMLTRYFATLPPATVVRLRDGPMKSFIEAVSYGRYKVNRS